MSTSPNSVNGLPTRRQTARDFTSDLVLASRMISAARDYADMALGVMYTLAQQLAAVGITLYDGSAPPQSRKITTLVTTDALIPLNPAPRTDLLPDSNDFETLQRGLPVQRDIMQQADETTHQELLPLNIRWMASFALRGGDDLLGTLDVYHSEPVTFSPGELDAYTVLADQISAAVRNQRLLDQMQAALNETRTLYDINRAILAATDTAGVLRALRETLAPDALIINHLTVLYDTHNRIQDVVIDCVNMPGMETAPALSLNEVIGIEQVARLNAAWNGENTYTVTFLENFDAPLTDEPLADFSRQSGLKSYVALSLREGGLLREAISIGFDYAQVFSDAQRRLYQSLTDQINIVLQTHRLVRETQSAAEEAARQVRILQIVNRLAFITNSAPDEQMLLDHSSQAAAEATGADHCSIALLNPADTSSRVVSEYPAIGTLGVNILLADNPIAEIVLKTRLPVVVADVNTDARLGDASRQVLQQVGVRALLIVPLILSDKMIGSMGLDITRPETVISPEMVDVALTLAAQLTLGMQTARLLAETQRRAEQLQHITAFSQSAQATLDLSAIFQNMLAESAQMLGHSQMSISLYDPAANALRVVAEHADGTTTVDPARREIIPISGHIARAWTNRELLHIPDLRDLQEPGDPTGDIRSWMLAPILARGGRPLGLVSVGSAQPFTYTPTDVALFQQMVTQLAVILENTETYSQSQRMAKNESLLNVLSTKLQSQTALQEMMDVTVNELGRALGARRARIRLGTKAPNGDSQEQETE